MDYQKRLEEKIKERGRRIFAEINRKKPSIFRKSRWINWLMESCMKNEQLKKQLFRFIGALPHLQSDNALKIFTKICFLKPKIAGMPLLLKLGFICASHSNFSARIFKASVEKMAKQFIVGENIYIASKNLKRLRRRGFALTVDILREAVANEEEAREYQRMNLALLDFLRKEAKTWQPLGETGAYLDWGYSPRINLSVKLSGLCHDINPARFDESVQKICKQLGPIVALAKFVNAEICIDMEEYKYKNITIEVYKQIRKDWPNIGMAIQSYLRDTDYDLNDLLQWARDKNLPIAIRLAKGAYWNQEVANAQKNGCESPVYLRKAETDAAFEQQAKKILGNHDICYLACASHNIRSIATVIETAKILSVPENCYEIQVLYGMAEPIRKVLLKETKRVRLYCPCGDILPGTAYLVRRLLENTANESILRQMFVKNVNIEELLENPLEILKRLQ